MAPAAARGPRGARQRRPCAVGAIIDNEEMQAEDRAKELKGEAPPPFYGLSTNTAYAMASRVPSVRGIATPFFHSIAASAVSVASQPAT